MIPYEVDPTLHSTRPDDDGVLDDGYSPPNPSHLPVEPEFPPQVPPSEADEPQPHHPEP